MHMIETFGSRLRKLRESQHLSQTKVASLIGVNKAAVSYYENDSRQPPLATLINLASTFGVTTDYLLGVEKKRPLNLSGLTESDIETLRYIIEKMVAANTTER